jgi:2-phospho-L-lactate guanylyltransferase
MNAWRLTPIAVVIPAKPFNEAKTRLSECLPARQRAALSRRLLRRTLKLALAVTDQVVVVSRDRVLLAEVEAAGATGLVEEAPGLNAALTQATDFARKQGAGGVLVLPADLPRLTAEDIRAVIELGARAPAVVIAPCRHETGTNALLVRPPGLVPFAFGPGSFAAHCAAAGAAGVPPRVYRSPTIALDLDTPEDWELIRSQFGI